MYKRRLVLLLVIFVAIGWNQAGGAPGTDADKEAKFTSHREKSTGWMRSSAEEYLDSIIKPPVTEWKLVEIRLPAERKIPSDFDDYDIALARSAHRGTSYVLTYRFFNNDRLIKKLNVTARVELFADVVVAKQKIDRNTTITEEMLGLEKLKIDSIKPDFCTQIANVSGKRAERNLKAGKPIYKSELGVPMDVKAGDIVMIVAEKENLKVTAKGVAKKSGLTGEMIPVINLRSNKKIFAEIIGTSKVRVNF